MGVGPHREAEGARQAEVRQLDSAIPVQQAILWLRISVCDGEVVEVLQRQQQVLAAADRDAQAQGDQFISCEHLLQSLSETDSDAKSRSIRKPSSGCVTRRRVTTALLKIGKCG